MHGSCHPRRRSARPGLVLVSVLALLAFSCFPAVSVAEGTVYETESPTIPDTKPKPKPTNNPDKGSSEDEAEKSDSPAGGGGSGSGGGSTGGSSPGTGSDGGTGQGNQGGGSKAGGDISQAEPVQTAKAPESKQVANETASDDGGSSSPLVPILIAIAVLAAISIAAVVIRQRRRGPGTPVSPNAS
jgi:hypothetical protein